MPKRILVISPHVDDVELAMGGTINRWMREGAEIHYVALSDCSDTLKGKKFAKDTLKQECRKALGVLGIDKERITIYQHTNKHYCEEERGIFESLEKLRERIEPELVVIPTPTDTHQDHQTVASQAISVFRRCTSILAYEQPWNTTTFTTDFFVRLSEADIRTKLKALAHYRSQHEFGKAYFDPEFLRSWARTRGMQVSTKYAEAFKVIKWIE